MSVMSVTTSLCAEKQQSPPAESVATQISVPDFCRGDVIGKNIAPSSVSHKVPGYQEEHSVLYIANISSQMNLCVLESYFVISPSVAVFLSGPRC